LSSRDAAFQVTLESNFPEIYRGQGTRMKKVIGLALATLALSACDHPSSGTAEQTQEKHHYLNPNELWAAVGNGVPRWEDQSNNLGEGGEIVIGQTERYETKVSYTKGRVYRSRVLPSSDKDVSYHYKEGYAFCLSTMPKFYNNTVPATTTFSTYVKAFVASILHPELTRDKKNKLEPTEEVAHLIEALGGKSGASVSRDDPMVQFYIYKDWLWRASFDNVADVLCAIPIVPSAAGRIESEASVDQPLDNRLLTPPPDAVSDARERATHPLAANQQPTAATSYVAPKLIAKVAPQYPGQAIRQRHEGTVLVRVEINREGGVVGTKVASSSGYIELDSAAAAAAGKIRFEPAQTGGVAVATYAEVPIAFSFSAHPASAAGPASEGSGSSTVERNVGASARRPSFDCLNASTATEHAICGSDDLSRLDARVGVLYRLVLVDSPPERQETVRVAQRRWIIERQAQCGGEASCIQEFLQSRSGQLQALL
jgi:TonB family protein